MGRIKKTTIEKDENGNVNKNSRAYRRTREVAPDKRVAIKLTREQEIEIFKSLVDKTATESMKALGLDSMFKNDGAIRIHVYNIISKIKKAPELWGLSQDAVDVVSRALDGRKIAHKTGYIKEREKEQFKDRLEVIRDTAADILTKKLSIINRNKQSIGEVKLKDISDVLKDATTALRVAKGESTENVIHYSKIDLDKVSPEEAMKLIFKAREALVENNKQ